MKLFYKKDGGVVQLIEREKIEEWSLELPLIFVSFIRNNKIRAYRDPKVEKEVANYLDVILKELAIPKIKEALSKGTQKDIFALLAIFEEISETKADAIRIIQDLIEPLSRNKNKSISARARKILANIK